MTSSLGAPSTRRFVCVGASASPQAELGVSMRVRLVLCFSVWAALLAVPALAQEATIIGQASDNTKAALPGVTITATSLETGLVTTCVSEADGNYRLRSLPPGRYKIQAELAGFATLVIPEIEVLVGQNRTVPITMQLAGLSETLTVTGESPLVDIS